MVSRDGRFVWEGLGAAPVTFIFDTMNPDRLNTFAAAYERNLSKAVADHPEEYGFPPSHVPTVAARMKNAFGEGSYNKDGRAVKATCKELGIPYTYTGINAYLEAA